MRILKLSLLFAILSVTSSSIFAQSEEGQVTHFSLGVSAGLSEDQWSLNSDVLHGDVTASSNGYLGYSGNISGVYSFCKHWKLKVSPGVRSKKLDYRLDGLHFPQDFDGLGFNESHIIYNVEATAFTIPVTVEYVFGTKKILPFISLGFAGEFIIKQSVDVTIYYSDGTTEQAAPGDLLRNSNVAAVAGAGIYYRATNKVSISVSPIFSYLLLEDAQELHQYSFGATAGVFYTFSR